MGDDGESRDDPASGVAVEAPGMQLSDEAQGRTATRQSIRVRSDVQDVDQAVVTPGDRFEFLDAGEFADERAIGVEGGSADDLHGPRRAKGGMREPDLAIAATTDDADQAVVGNVGGLVGGGLVSGDGLPVEFAEPRLRIERVDVRETAGEEDEEELLDPPSAAPTRPTSAWRPHRGSVPRTSGG